VWPLAIAIDHHWQRRSDLAERRLQILDIRERIPPSDRNRVKY
jgi:hypothetical protein